MSGWTKKNFGELADRSKDPSMRWLFARDEIDAEQVGPSLFRFEPGARMPFGHRHGQQEEVYIVVRGSGRFKLDDEIVDVAEWDVIRVAPETWRAYEAGSDGLDLICIGGPRPEGNDNEGDRDFWPAGG
jgi:mannose-6-phosphate isomerase-like protein (cupin superfamily)